jgi:ribosomal protein S18 acetylase RimI-like enzyme
METAPWLARVNIRHIMKAELDALEWEGAYTHYRLVYADAYQRMQNGFTVMWVAYLPGAGVIGQLFVQLSCDRPELADGHGRGYIFAFRVRPAYRSGGLGRRMLRVAEGDLIRRGFSTAVLNVAQTNLDAQRLYQRLGYRITAPDPGRWSYPDDKGIWRTEEEPAWRMEKPLEAVPYLSYPARGA